MKKQVLSRLKPLLIAITFIFICMAVVGVAAWSPSIRPQQQTTQASQRYEPVVENRTQAFHLVSIEATGNSPRLLFRNDYPNIINGFQLAIDSDVKQIDFLNADEEEDQGISPGEVFEYPHQIRNSNLTPRIVILAVMFEDGSGDGVQKYVDSVKEMRKGLKIQYKRALPLLQDALNVPETGMMDALVSLQTQLSNLPTEKESKKLSDDAKFGLHSAKENMLNEILRIKYAQQKYGDIKMRDALKRLKEKSEKIVNKLQG